jgi:glycosyltransferase involved in cell wall biosynthesis
MITNTEATKELPLVSIVIPAYNREKWIGKAIRSAQEQDYPNLEIVINDDCSTDNTVKVIESFLEDKRIRFFKNEKNLGIALNYHRTFMELAKGEFLMNLGSDDYLESPSFISDAIRESLKHDNIGLIFGKSTLYFDETEKMIPYDEEDAKLFFKKTFNKGMEIFHLPPHIARGWGGCLMNARIMRANDIHFSDIKLCDDQRINFMLMAVSDVICINQPCYIIRMHGSNLGSTAMSAQSAIHDILGMIEQVYAFATKRKADRKEALENWKYDFLFYHIRYTLSFLLVNNRTEYKKFAAHVREVYPDIYRKIITSRKFLYVKYIYNPLTRPIRRALNI